MIGTIISSLVKVHTTDDSAYEFVLAVCSDGLYVMNCDKTKILETIVLGLSNEATLLQANDENSFLDGINAIKEVLLKGLNPLIVFNLY